MKQYGIISAKKNEYNAEIDIIPHEACHKCGSCSAKEIKTVTFTGKIPEGIEVGDHVEIEVGSSYLMLSYFLLYVFPLILFFITLFTIYKFTSSPLVSFTGGVASIIGAYFLVGIFFRKDQQVFRHLNIRKI